MMTIREALISMGYREVKTKHWLKPIGYQIFTFHEEKNEWANYFLAATDKIECWEIKSFDKEENEDYLSQLKSFECWTRTDIFVLGNSHFELSAYDL